MMDIKLGYSELIIAEGKAYGLLRNQLAYVLATAYWETARTMKPVKEAYWIKNAEAWRRKNLRYYPWYGRGFVQLTWEANYIKAGKMLGLDLTTDPDKVMVPDVAAKILVRGSAEAWFTKYKLADFISLKRSDFIGARRIINGTDKARAIAEIAREYDALLKADGYGETETPPMHDPAMDVVNDAAADDRISTTEVVAIGTGVSGAAKAVKETVDAVQDTGATLLSAGPWVLLSLVVAGFGAYIWIERKRKKKTARLAKAAM